jgi:hypothetical protein
MSYVSRYAIRSHTLFADHFKASQDISPFGPGLVERDDIRVLRSNQLEQEVATKCAQGFEVAGWAEFAAKGDCGIAAEAADQASRVGACLVLFSFWPAKLRAIRYLPDGSIDLAAVLADPPAALTPKGYFVTKAAFLRPGADSSGLPQPPPQPTP